MYLFSTLVILLAQRSKLIQRIFFQDTKMVILGKYFYLKNQIVG